MNQTTLIEPDEVAPEQQDNITDWCLQEFQQTYDDLSITKDDIWEYLYGVMHAPDWRERYANDLKKSLPRVPLAKNFEAFRRAGRELMDLHIGYETCPEHPDVRCVVDGQFDEGEADAEAYRIGDKEMDWGKTDDGEEDKSVMVINSRCSITNIPSEAEDYKISGRSPLKWAMVSLTHKNDDDTGYSDNPNLYYEWKDDPFNLIRHFRRLVFVACESARIIKSLPPSLDNQE